MINMNSSTLLRFLNYSVVFLFLPPFLFPSSIAQYLESCTQRAEYCWNCISDVNASTAYKQNLNTLLASFLSKTNNNYGFYNSSFGQNSERVNAIALCRGDVAPNECRDCVNETSSRLLTNCPGRKEAIIWGELCTVRYSDTPIFYRKEESPFKLLPSPNPTADPEKYRNVLDPLLERLRSHASSGDSLRKFADGYRRVPDEEDIYGFLQCTPDLTHRECSDCLLNSTLQIPGCCGGRSGARVLKPSCSLRYEYGPFYNVTAFGALPDDDGSTAPPPPTGSAGKSQISTTLIVSIAVPIAAVLLLSSVGYYFLRRRAKYKYDAVREGNDGSYEMTTVESLQFDLSTIKAATDNFSGDNKLGEGGFGEVYKGTLANGQRIAAKRLSGSSRQGAEEFKTEVRLVSKLQHRNLVRILGFCLEGEEKILVYEFVPNNSLDHFLFDLGMQGQLDWSRRYKIINGIAQGLLYLHEDSRLKIIHRNLKPSNILLDKEMNPKISDFGIARIFGVDQTQGNTSRIVGTYGYMSPEYAFYGRFSAKSDVYSFGVLILEIITGKKNSSYHQLEGAMDLMSYVWKHWTDETALEVLDPSLGNSYSRNEASRCIHIGLLCLEEDPEERPSMATIVLLLSSHSVSLALPRKPAFFPQTRTDRDMPSIGVESSTSTTKSKLSTLNEMSISENFPR